MGKYIHKNHTGLMAQQPQSSGAGEALVKVLSPLLDKMKTDITNELKAVIVATGQAQELKIDNLQKEVQVLTGVVGGQKKTITRAKADNPPTTTVTTNDSVIPQPVGNKKSFPGNKLIYFREQYRTNEEFRNKYATEEIRKLISEDPTCKSKTNAEQKLLAEINFCWNHLKNNHPTIINEIEERFKEAKKLHADANEVPQQSAESHTPEGV